MNPILLYRATEKRSVGFTSTWNTNNTSTGSSAANQIALPLLSNGLYNFVVNWGDGNSNTITVWNQAETTHTYAAAGNYTLTITGTCYGWRFNNTGDRLKILTISRWGGLRLNHTTPASGNFFNGCANLNLSGLTDVLDMTNVTSMINAFSGCTTLTTVGRMNEWNMINVTTMQSMFDGCTNFNQDISLWNVTNNAQFGAMFRNCPMFNQNLGAWNVTKSTALSQMFFGCTAFNNGGSNTINNWVMPSTGSFISMFEMFRGCANFNQPIGNWNLNRVSTTSGMFNSASVFNQNIGGWDMSNNTNLSSMFQSASAFNNGGSNTINNWITSAVTLFSSMFQSAAAFNQPVGSWNTNAGQNFSSMFNSCTVFNNGLASGVAGTIGWTTNVATNMANMFQSCPAFNQNIGSFTLTAVTAMGGMFNGCTTFNNGGSSTISSWNTAACGNFNSIFNACPAFNQPVANWNVSNSSSLASMFNACTAFNQNVGHFRPNLATNIINFLAGKTPATYSTTNVDAIYNGWTQGALQPTLTLTMGTAKYTTAAVASRALLTRANATITVTGAVNSGGLIRLTATAHGRATNDKVFVTGVGGVPNADGGWIVTVIDANTVDLQGSTFAGAFTSGGTFRTGYGWTITDGGL